MRFITKVGNTRMALKASLNPAEDFTNVNKVYFSMTEKAKPNKIFREVNNWNEPNIIVIFTKSELVAGSYIGEFHVLYTDGKVDIFPSDTYLSIIIKEATGEVT